MAKRGQEGNDGREGDWKRIRVGESSSNTEQENAPQEVIVISDDDENEEMPPPPPPPQPVAVQPPPEPVAVPQPFEEYPADTDIRDLNIWYLIDPEGRVQGPTSIFSLKLWWDAGWFPSTLTIYLGGIYAYNINVVLSAYFPTN